MKVFHIFVTCVNKWQQRSNSKFEDVPKSKSSSDCVIESILEYHKIMTMDFEDECWKNDQNSISRYIFSSCSSFYCLC